MWNLEIEGVKEGSFVNYLLGRWSARVPSPAPSCTAVRPDRSWIGGSGCCASRRGSPPSGCPGRRAEALPEPPTLSSACPTWNRSVCLESAFRKVSGKNDGSSENVTRGGAVPNWRTLKPEYRALVEHRHRLGSCPRDLPEDQILSVNNYFKVAVMD